MMVVDLSADLVVVSIGIRPETTLARETGHMRSSTAAALVGAAVLSTLVYPILGLRLRGDIDPMPEPEADAKPQRAMA